MPKEWFICYLQTWKECIFLLLGGTPLMSIRSYWLVVLLTSFIVLLIFCLVVLSVVEREKGVEVSNYNCRFFYFSFLFYWF